MHTIKNKNIKTTFLHQTVVSIVYRFGINIIRRSSMSDHVSNSILLGKQYSLVDKKAYRSIVL